MTTSSPESVTSAVGAFSVFAGSEAAGVEFVSALWPQPASNPITIDKDSNETNILFFILTLSFQ
jgi:hypothetical protein